jgi:uncharacterized surface protein with fasciclin (FAS1) repeats
MMSCSLVRSQEDSTTGNLFDIIERASNFSFLKVLLEQAGLDYDLRETMNSKITIFGPTDEPFLQIDEERLTNIITDFQWRLHLMNILGYHMVENEIPSDVIANGSTFENLVDETVTVARTAEGDIMVNNVAKIVQSIPATNGVIYAVDALIGPPWLSMTINDVLEKQPSRFSTFLRLGGDIDLFVNMIHPSEPFTVFAPTNDAFESIGIGFLNNLDSVSWFDILGYHVVRGIFTSSDLMALNELETITGDKLAVAMDPMLRALTVDGVSIRETNILANNGIVHVVNSILSPDDSLNMMDPEELDECSYLKAFEESLGTSFNVQCNCNPIARTYQLSCLESDGRNCAPKFARCETDLDCCSSPFRRCVGQQCRDSSSPNRVRLGGGEHGGAAGRAFRDRNIVTVDSTLP